MNKSKIIFLAVFLLLSFSHFKCWSQNEKYCDSLISKGIDLMWAKKHEKIKLELQNYKRESDAKDLKIRNERFYYFTILSAMLLIMVFILVTYRNQAIKNTQCKLIDQRNQEITLLKLQQEKDANALSMEKEKIALLEQEKLKHEIELKNQKIASKALHLSGKDQLLQELLRTLAKAPEISKNKTLTNQIKELKKHIGTQDDWNSFILHFEEVNGGLLQKLKTSHPELTQNDIRYISYEYMNLSTKEIAAMLNITPDACRKRKERIVGKLGLTDNITLASYLSIV